MIAACIVLFLVFSVVLSQYSHKQQHYHHFQQCPPDGEGSWSIGFVFGQDPLHLRAPGRSSRDGHAYPCIRNPIISCQSVTDVMASFVADPFLYIPKMRQRNSQDYSRSTLALSSAASSSVSSLSSSQKWFIFFEVKNKDKNLRRGSGQIGCAVSEDRGQSWTYLQIVFKLNPKHYKWQHLSYPFVFGYKNDHYMLPQQWGPCTLFRASDDTFPTGWEEVATLSPHHYIDPNLVYYHGQWWLIGFLSFSHAHFLHVSYSKIPDDPLGPYIETPFNCVNSFESPGKNKGKTTEYSEEEIAKYTRCVGTGGGSQSGGRSDGESSESNTSTPVAPHKFAYTSRPFQHVSGLRPGGSVFVYQNRLFRFVQNSERSYGDSLDLYEITVLTKTERLQERLVPEFRQYFRGTSRGSSSNSNSDSGDNAGNSDSDRDRGTSASFSSPVGLWNSARYHHMSVQMVSSLNDSVNDYSRGTSASDRSSNGSDAYWVGVTDGDSRVDRGGTETEEAIELRRLEKLNPYILRDSPEQSESFQAQCITPKLKALSLALKRDEAGLNKAHLFSIHRQKPAEQRNRELCIFTALSSNHYHEYLRALEGIMRFYPCNRVYIYDLGLTPSQLVFLKTTVPLLTVLKLESKRPYFEFKACVFKPVALLDIMDGYGYDDSGRESEDGIGDHTQHSSSPRHFYHQCKDVLYMDTSIRFKSVFDTAAYSELDKTGVLAEQQSALYSQIEFTHPGMYNWFGVNREKDYEDYKQHVNTSTAGNRLMQIQAGLMLVNTLNETIRNRLFLPWKECADDKECLSPGGFITQWASEKPLQQFKVYDTQAVFRAHRDDQSAFTFLMDKNFGHGETTSRRGPTYLNDYVHPVWHSRSNEAKVAALANRLQCIPGAPI